MYKSPGFETQASDSTAGPKTPVATLNGRGFRALIPSPRRPGVGSREGQWRGFTDLQVNSPLTATKTHRWNH